MNNLDTACLKALYDQQLNVMQTKLLTGSSWQEIQDDRRIATELAIELHKRAYPLNSSFNPAGHLRFENLKPDDESPRS